MPNKEPFLDLVLALQPLCSAEVIKKAITTSSPQAPSTAKIYRSPEQAAAFYGAMHAHGIGEALEWPKHADLSQHRDCFRLAHRLRCRGRKISRITAFRSA